MVLTLPAAASDFGARYPAGSIVDAAAAQAALKEADAEMAEIARRAKVREAECYRGFFVNSCRDDVRRERELAEREVRRVRVEAGDLQRRIDAEQVAKKRDEKEAARAVEDAQRPQKDQKARAAAKAREPEMQTRAPAVAKERAPSQAVPAKSVAPDRPPQDRLTAAERAENVRKYQQKQEQALKRAQEIEVERKENELRRAEKRKQVEQREAEREAIRKKAAESIQ